MLLDGNIWPKFINNVSMIKTENIIECSAICSLSDCDLYSFQNDKICHLGLLENTQVFLPLKLGSHKIHVSFGKAIRQWNQINLQI